MTDKNRAIPSGRAIVNGAGQAVSAVPASVPIAGDRVVLTPDIGRCQPYRGWAERGRVATVLNVFTPNGGRRVVVKVRFDRTRAKGTAGEHYFSPDDLLPAQGIEARSGETERLDPKDESPVPQECAHPDPGSDDDRRRG